MDVAISKNNVKIRLTPERWLHITEGHPEMAGYYYEVLEAIQEPDFIYKGSYDELLAVRNIGIDIFIIVVYKETSKTNGFVITAFISKKINYLQNKELLWEKKK